MRCCQRAFMNSVCNMHTYFCLLRQSPICRFLMTIFVLWLPHSWFKYECKRTENTFLDLFSWTTTKKKAFTANGHLMKYNSLQNVVNDWTSTATAQRSFWIVRYVPKITSSLEYYCVIIVTSISFQRFLNQLFIHRYNQHLLHGITYCMPQIPSFRFFCSVQKPTNFPSLVRYLKCGK